MKHVIVTYQEVLVDSPLDYVHPAHSRLTPLEGMTLSTRVYVRVYYLM